jgi:hypothetical protein
MGVPLPGVMYAVDAVFRRSLLVIVLALGAGSCQREEVKQKPRAVPTRVKRPPRPIPPEPPFGPLEVDNSGFPCDVDAALKAKCRRCHTTPARHGAPFALLTWEQTQEDFRGTPISGHIARAVKSGFMPYRILTNPPVESLTDAEKQAIVSWAESGAPRASCEPPSEKPVTAKKTRKARPKTSL